MTKLATDRLALLQDAPETVIFLDIETTGLSHYYDEITLIGWSIAAGYDYIIAGENIEALVRALKKASAIVTFNGTLFDLKFLRRAFPDIEIPELHIDLRYLARRVSLTGGQKSIERELGIDLRQGLQEVDGAEAVLLWHRFIRGDNAALMRLIDYNRRDVFAMRFILDAVIGRFGRQLSFWSRSRKFADGIELPELPQSSSRISRWRKKNQFVSHTFKALFSGTIAEKARIVGIDLTGSAARPSGFAVLDGNRVTTTTLGPDEALIEHTVRANPKLVSIDSPLSLPRGRIKVTDDDPGRDEFGIMRICERTLKRRGINVYPCLLPSMQRLTERGMRLAEAFRKCGIPVIESYPGAAQDIMRIPRKGDDKTFLAQGLREFGIDGELDFRDISHDELDAITSAVVGSFFLAGKFEGLSGPEEGSLIIPDLTARFDRVAIGISGSIAAGKTTLANFFKDQGFAYTRISLVIDDELERRGIALSREARQRLGIELHETRGQRWLMDRALERVEEAPRVVVDGLRFPEDRAALMEAFSGRATHIHVVAENNIRRDRYLRLGEESRDFVVADSAPVEQKIQDLAGLADCLITNESDFEALRRFAGQVVAPQ